MKKEAAKTVAKTACELSEGCAETVGAISETTGAVKTAKPLWRTGKRSPLIKAGLALIAFPDPTISDVVGGAMVAAGLVQEGIQRQALHIDDVYKTFQKTMKEIQNVKP